MSIKIEATKLADKLIEMEKENFFSIIFFNKDTNEFDVKLTNNKYELDNKILVMPYTDYKNNSNFIQERNFLITIIEDQIYCVITKIMLLGYIALENDIINENNLR